VLRFSGATLSSRNFEQLFYQHCADDLQVFDAYTPAINERTLLALMAAPKLADEFPL